MTRINKAAGTDTAPRGQNLPSSSQCRHLCKLIGALAAGVLLSLGAGAAAAAAAALIVTEPAGTLVLDLGNAKRWTYTGSTIPSHQMLISNSDCTLNQTEAPLMVLAGTSGTPGYRDSGTQRYLGLAGSGNNCGVINTAQTLTMTLGSDLADKVFTRVDLSLFMEKNAILQATVLNGGEPVASFKVYSGTSESLAGPGDHKCSAGEANSGPNSPNTNCELSFSAVGNGLRLSAVSEGGGSAAGQVRVGGLGSTSTFTIANAVVADGQIDCDQEAKTVIKEFLHAGEASHATVQCKRLDNYVADLGPSVPGNIESCEAVNYALDATAGDDLHMSLLYAPENDDLTNTTKLAFVCEAWWPEQTAQFTTPNGGPPVLTMPPTRQAWGPSPGLPEPGVPLAFCEGVTPVVDHNTACAYEPGGAVTCSGLDAITGVSITPPDLDQVPALAGNQVGCLLDERVRLTEDASGVVKFYQLWYVKGDYTALRAR